jgi:hypothetical protein
MRVTEGQAMTADERLDRLERQNVRLRVGLVLVLLMSLLTGCAMTVGEPMAERSRSP